MVEEAEVPGQAAEAEATPAAAGDNVMKTFLPFLAVLTLSAQVKTFDTPEAAAQAVIAAAEKNDVAALNAIFGANSKAILTSGDPKQDAEERAEFARVARAKNHIEKDPMNLHRVMLDIGPQDWPFPVPIVEKDGKWSFEPAQGELEVRARRIGANEIDIIDMCAGFVQAQQQYAEADRDKDGILEYAEFLMSEPGKDDGLYSDSARANSESPGRSRSAPWKSEAGALSRLLFPHADFADRVRPRRHAYQLHGAGQTHDGRIRAGRVARAIRRHRHSHFHRESGWRGLRKRSGNTRLESDSARKNLRARQVLVARR